MRRLFLLFILIRVGNILPAQGVYTIKADSVKLTGCDSSELIIENHTQNVPGFLFNTGNGRTIFKRGVVKLNDSLYQIGGDTLKIRTAWLQGGNAFGITGKLGTLDNNNLDFYTNNSFVARMTPMGHFLIGTGTDGDDLLFVNGRTTIIAPDANRSLKVMDNFGFGIGITPNYGSSADGAGSALITFGSINASIGVNKSDYHSIPLGSLSIGATSPGRITSIIDYGSNPTYVTDGSGQVTINGGYRGILGGDSGIVANQGSYDFTINGGRGTGNGAAGDIIFSTGNSLGSGTTMHTMTNRWWLKGGTGYLSNASSPSSALDITGSNGYSQLRLRTTYTPSSTSDTHGNTGDFGWDDNYLYIKTSSGWKRTALSTF